MFWGESEVQEMTEKNRDFTEIRSHDVGVRVSYIYEHVR